MNYSCYSDATVDAYLDEALAADDVEASYPLWQQSEWDGVGGIAPTRRRHVGVARQREPPVLEA